MQELADMVMAASEARSQHGKPALVQLREPRGKLFEGLPSEFQARAARNPNPNRNPNPHPNPTLAHRVPGARPSTAS